MSQRAILKVGKLPKKSQTKNASEWKVVRMCWLHQIQRYGRRRDQHLCRGVLLKQHLNLICTPCSTTHVSHMLHRWHPVNGGRTHVFWKKCRFTLIVRGLWVEGNSPEDVQKPESRVNTFSGGPALAAFMYFMYIHVYSYVKVKVWGGITNSMGARRVTLDLWTTQVRVVLSLAAAKGSDHVLLRSQFFHAVLLFEPPGCSWKWKVTKGWLFPVTANKSAKCSVVHTLRCFESCFALFEVGNFTDRLSSGQWVIAVGPALWGPFPLWMKATVCRAKTHLQLSGSGVVEPFPTWSL